MVRPFSKYFIDFGKMISDQWSNFTHNEKFHIVELMSTGNLKRSNAEFLIPYLNNFDCFLITTTRVHWKRFPNDFRVHASMVEYFDETLFAHLVIQNAHQLAKLHGDGSIHFMKGFLTQKLADIISHSKRLS